MKTFLQMILFFFITAKIAFSQPITFETRGLGGGGALFAPSINPVNESEFYIGCDMSELFRSTDFGNTYTQEHFQTIQGGHHSTMRFTSIVNQKYCIDYSGYYPQPVKSFDGGISWNALSGNPNPNDETYSIHVDFNQSNHVIISSYEQVYFSDNGGNSFTSIHTATNGSNGINIGGTFFDGNNIFIGTNDGLIISTDNGANFSVANIGGIPAGEAIFSFAGAKENNMVRFFCLTANPADIYAGITGADYWGFIKGVYSLDYGAPGWIQKMNGININTDFLMYAGMSQNDIDVVYLAGSSSNGEPSIMKTTNAGTSWSSVFAINNNQNINTGWCGHGGDRSWGYAECAFGFAVAPQNSNKVLFTDYGFVHTTTNGGATWKQAYLNTADQNPVNSTTPVLKNYRSNGMENTTCWSILWADATHLFAAFSDINGLRSDNGGLSWKMAAATTLNSTYRFVKHPNTTIYAATSSVHDIYQTTRLTDALLDVGDGDIRLSANGGLFWQTLHDFNHPVIWITLDPNNATRMYASVIHYAGGVGEGGIWTTADLQNGSTSTWTKLANPPRTEGHPFNIHVLNDGTLVCSYSGRRNGIGAFTPSSGVFKMNAGSSNWTDVSDSGMLYYTKDVVIDPYDVTQNTWYACVWGGWGGPPNGLGGLYKTINRGQTWTRIFSGTDRVSSITFSPTNPNHIWMTTETDGLWRCTNINAGSPTFTQVNSYPFRQPERVFYNPYNTNELWITSFGNGMKVANLSATDVSTYLFKEEEPFTVFPNPAKSKFIVRSSFDNLLSRIEMWNTTGKIIFKKNIDNAHELITDVAMLPRGVYFVKLFSEGKITTVKMLLE